VVGNVISDNRGAAGGGVYSLNRGYLLVSHNVVEGNASAGHGPGINITGAASTVTIAGNVVARNAGSATSEGIYTNGGMIYGNTIVGQPIGVYAVNAKVVNNVIAGNDRGVNGALSAFRDNCEWNNVNYTTTADPTGANGNFVADPRLAHPAAGDYHLQPDSPCVDTGDDTVVGAGETDMDGQPRVQGAHVDIGADESDGTTWPVTPVVLHVRPDGSDAADGLTWGTAKATPGAALSATAAGDEVWVAAGAYKTAGSLILRPHVSLYGGFAGTETERDARDPAKWTTLLSHISLSGPSIVVAPPGVTTDTVIDGFTITGGIGTLRDGVFYGGGIFCDQSSPTISNNVITANTGARYGGGVAALGGSPVLIANVITGNSVSVTLTSGGGGGVACIGGSALLMDNVFSRNVVTGTPTTHPAGGVYLSQSAATVTGNWFDRNRNAVASVGGSSGVVVGNVFQYGSAMDVYCEDPIDIGGNTFLKAGGYAVFSEGASPAIHDNFISGASGTALWVHGGAPVVERNVVSDGVGSALYAYDASVILDSNRISGYTGGASPTISLSATQPAAARLLNNDISDNRGSYNLIRVNLPAQSSVEISGNTIARNTAATTDLVNITTPGPVFRNNHVIGNHAADPTAYAAIIRAYQADARDNVFESNGGTWEATAVTLSTIRGSVSNNTFVDNGAPSGGDAFYVYGGTAANNIVAFNHDGVAGLYGPDAPVLRDNIVYGNKRGNYRNMADPTGTDGNVSVDPLFVDRAAGNYRLAAGSPAINTGDDSVVLPGELDADFSARILGPHVDIGAYESAEHHPGILADAIRALRLAAGLDIATPDDLADLDVETSGMVDIKDATRLMRRAVGLDTP
jgi:hypothetical protein